MKLFDALFQILIYQGEKLMLGGDLEIYALKTKESPEEETSYYLNFDHGGAANCPTEQHHPTREQIEEHLAKIILEEEARPKQIADFLNKNLQPKNNPLSSGKSIKEVLKNNHPEIVRMVETYTDDQELINATADLIVEMMKKKALSDNPEKRNGTLGSFNKEYYEDLIYNPEKDIFIYKEGDPMKSGPNNVKEFKAEEEFKEELEKYWIKIKDGWITGKGNPVSYIPYWLKDMGLGSIREYIEKKK